jgi:hypothetical protein
MEFSFTQVLLVKKGDSCVNSAFGAFLSYRTHQNSLFQDKNKHYVTKYVMVYKVMIHVMLFRMCELYPAPKVEGSYFPNSSRIYG